MSQEIVPSPEKGHQLANDEKKPKFLAIRALSSVITNLSNAFVQGYYNLFKWEFEFFGGKFILVSAAITLYYKQNHLKEVLEAKLDQDTFQRLDTFLSQIQKMKKTYELLEKEITKQSVSNHLETLNGALTYLRENNYPLEVINHLEQLIKAVERVRDMYS